MTRPGPGWYRDPNGGDFERWFDGNAWTEFTRAFQVPPRDSGGHRKGISAMTVVIMVIIIGAYVLIHNERYQSCLVKPSYFDWPSQCF